MIQLLKMSYAAEKSGVEVETLAEWILEGSFPAVKVPKAGWMVRAPALEKWLQDGGKTAHQPGTFANSHELKLGSDDDEDRDDADDDVGVVVPSPKLKQAVAKERRGAARPQLITETPQVNSDANGPKPAQPVPSEQLPNDVMACFETLKSSRCVGPEQYSLMHVPDIVTGLHVTEETVFSWFRSGLKPVPSKGGPLVRVADLERFLKRRIKRRASKKMDTDLAPPSSDEHSPDASKPEKSSGPVAYWRPVTPHDPCSICLRRFRCSISKNGLWSFCGQIKSAQWMPGGYLHPRPAYPGDVTEGWRSLVPEIELQLLLPIWDQDAYDRLDWNEKLPRSVRHCCRAGLVRGNRATGEISQALKPCNSKHCSDCGRRYGRAVLTYMWSVWSRLELIYWSPEFLIDNVGRVRDRIRKLADSQGAQYCLIRRQDGATVFATQPLRGRKEPTDWHALSPVDALEKLQYSLRLPELQLKFSTSEIGDWQLPHVHEPPDEEGETSSHDGGHQQGGDARAATPHAVELPESDSAEVAANLLAAAGTETCTHADQDDNNADEDYHESTPPGDNFTADRRPDDADQQPDRADSGPYSDEVSFGFRTIVKLDKTLEEIWVQRAPEHFDDGVNLRKPPPGVTPEEFLRDLGRELNKSAELAPPPASPADEDVVDDD